MKRLFLITAGLLISVFITPGRAQDGDLKATVPFLPDIAAAGWDFNAPPWDKAGRVPGFLKMGGISMMGMSYYEEAKHPTRVWMARDGEALYFAFECLDPKPDELATTVSKEENAFPSGDRIEIYLEGDQGPEQAYYHLVFDPAGTRWRALHHNRIEAGDWSVKTKIETDRWKAVVRIPYPTLGLKASQTTTRGMFYRMFQPRDLREQSTWGGRGVHQFSQLGTLELEPLPTP